MYKRYISNVLSIFLSSSVAQIVSLFGTVWLGRLLLPDEFAELGLYTGLVAIMLTFATGRLEVALIKLNSLSDWSRTVITSSYLLLVCSIVFYVISLTLNINLLTESLCLYFSTGLLFTGINKNLANLLSAQQNYKALGQIRILEAVLFIIISIIIKYLSTFDHILVLSMVLTQISVAIISMYVTKVKLMPISYKSAREIIIGCKDYVLIDSAGAMLNTLSRQLPILTLPFIIGLEASGLYFFAYRLVAMPTALVSNSVGNVFRKTAVLEYDDTGSFRSIFTYTMIRLILISCIGLIMFYSFIDRDVITNVFGNKWIGIYEIMNLLVIGFAAKFIVSPLTFIFYIVERLDINFFGQLVFLILVSMSLLLVYILSLEVITSVSLLVLSQCLIYSLYFYLTLKYVK